MNDLVNSLPRRIVAAACSTRSAAPGRSPAMGLYVGALVRSDKRLERPDLQINMFAWATEERNRDGVVPQPFSAFGLSPVHLRPDGRGTVRLKSADPLAAPEIRFNFLKSANDMQALIQGMRICREIAAAAGARSRSWSRRSCPARTSPSEADLKADIRARGVSNLHPVGTCRMGRGPTPWSIRSCGCTASRGCAWPMPRSCRPIVAGNTNAPSIMIGEKCAAMILEDAA